MNEIIQNILVFVTLGLALAFLIRKFILPVRKSSSAKACGSKDGCGCS